MNKRHLIIIPILLGILSCASQPGTDEDKKIAEESRLMDSSEYKSAYLELLDRGNYEKLLTHIGEWEQLYPRDPEMFIAFFNYYLNRNLSNGVAMGDNPPSDEEHLAISDPDTGEIVGYMYDETVYDVEDVSHAISYLNKGLEFSPDRLDMYFGKIHVLQEVGDYLSQAQALSECLHRSQENDNHWLWSDGEVIGDGFDFMINSIQDYYHVWLNIASESSLEAIRVAGAVQIELYPRHVYGYNDIAYSYILTGDYDGGLQYLLLAEEVDPSDIIVLNNIFLCFVEVKNKEKATEYLEKLKGYPDQVDLDRLQGYLEEI